MLLVGGECSSLAMPGTTERVSVDSEGNEGNGQSGFFDGLDISADGRYVAFKSDATNLVEGDTNGCSDVFVHDRQTGTTERVSVDGDGNEGNFPSGGAAISADGRYVAFYSSANNLVPDDTNGQCDVFVHDRQTGTTERVSVDSAGNQGNGQSGFYYGLDINADGRYVAFYSYASNLVPGDTNMCWGGTVPCPDVFVHDRQTHTTERVSVDSDGSEANDFSERPALSADGSLVVFESWASNLVPGDTNGQPDIFVHVRSTGTTERVSVGSGGIQAIGPSGFSAISANGQYVAFRSHALNLVPDDTNAEADIFVHDRVTGFTERVSVDSAGGESNDYSVYPRISNYGRYVAFRSVASNLVPDDTNGQWDVFVHDRHTGTTERVSVDGDGNQGNGDSGYGVAVSVDGRYVAFESEADNLVTGDTNAVGDAFVHDRGPVGPVDTDGDGIPDAQDACPDTPAGQPVDAQGCSEQQYETLLAEKFSPVLWLADGDYEPEEVQIMLDEDERPNCTTELRRHRGRWFDDHVAHCPTAETLANNTNPNNYIDIAGIDVGEENKYRQQYNTLSNSYDLVTYADVQLDEGEVLIDYWFFYYYNDFFAFDHEGDLERIRVRISNASTIQQALSPGVEPEQAWYSQHLCDGDQTLVRQSWSGIERLGPHPVAYVAQGSHANYFDNGPFGSGIHTPINRGRGPCTVYDHTFEDKLLFPAVILVDCEKPALDAQWLSYNGRWGQWPGARGPCRD